MMFCIQAFALLKQFLLLDPALMAASPGAFATGDLSPRMPRILQLDMLFRFNDATYGWRVMVYSRYCSP